ncbi:MAG: tetratricopeptide repeat protein [Elainellaceae cyanobacterium]
MIQTPENAFDEALKRYGDGESAETLIPVFKEICDRAPKNSPAWTCLSWLYLLAEKPNSAYKAAQKAVKLHAEDPQARVNLAIAMLETDRKGVRQHIDVAQQVASAVPELRQELQKNFEDGIARRPSWPALIRVQRWMFED